MRDKQIDEMAKIIVRENCMKEPCVNCNYGDYVIGEIDCIEYLIAENLYKAGYRKASDVIEEYRQKVNTKMGKHTHLLGKEYVQRILREVKKEMLEGKE